MGSWAIIFLLLAFSIPTRGERNFGGWRAGGKGFGEERGGGAGREEGPGTAGRALTRATDLSPHR